MDALNILNTLGDKNYETSPNSEDFGSNLFSDNIPEYNSNRGFLQINNPGWIKIFLKNPQKISYIRFLLWDNRGSEAKRQPSNRKYTYRLLVAEADQNNDPIDRNGKIVWSAIYENSLNPSNGWQEFYFEDGAKDILAIKIQFFQNTSASRTHGGATQLVSIQAYEQPTESILRLLEDTQWGNQADTAPQPTYGFIRNRVIIGGEQEVVNNLVRNEIINKVTTYIKNMESEAPQLRILGKELEQGIGKNEVEKQIDILNHSILKPIETYDRLLSKRAKKYSILATAFFAWGILKELVEICCLSFDWEFPLTIAYFLNFIVK